MNTAAILMMLAAACMQAERFDDGMRIRLKGVSYDKNYFMPSGRMSQRILNHIKKILLTQKNIVHVPKRFIVS